MKKRLGTSSAIVLGLLGFAPLLLALALTPARVAAQCGNQADLTDTDSDGFTNYWECTGLPLTCGGTLPQTSLNVKDLFVFLVRANPSNIPASPFDPFALAKTSLANVVNIHVIEGPCNTLLSTRVVSTKSTQKAIKITEDPSTSVTEVGSSNPGVPRGRDEAKIYPNRIMQKLLEACPCLSNNTCNATCRATSGAYLIDDLYKLYIQNTIAHEIGHLIRPLHQPYTTKYEYHYQEGTNTPPLIMERAIVATKDTSGVMMIPIGKDYGSTDIGNIKLLP